MEQKKTGKWKLISRFLKGNVHMFVLVFIFSMLNTLFNALTPQIVRISVDSVIGGADWQLPGVDRRYFSSGKYPTERMARSFIGRGSNYDSFRIVRYL